jgi:hypothetical protein
MNKVPIWRRYDRLLGSDRAPDVKAELRFHIEPKTEDLIARGWPAEAAREEAERQFGNICAVQRIGERMGEHMELHSRISDYWSECLQDARYTLRTLLANPTFSTVAILVLALGIGANIAVFSLVNTILLRPLPFRDSQQLVRIVEKDGQSNESGRTYTADATQDFQQQNRSFQSVSGYFAFTSPNNFKLAGNGQPLPATGMLVAEGFFAALGVEPAAGRLFRPEEFVHHAQPAALLSYRFWKRQFGGNRSIIGRTIDLSDKVDLNNKSVIVVGVLPETFDFGSVFSPGAKVDVFVPYIMDDFRDDGNDLALVGRLKPGVSIAQAQNEADLLFPQLFAVHKHPDMGSPTRVNLPG